MDAPPNCFEHFGHFQDFSQNRSEQPPMYQYGLHDFQIPEEMISPRMPIPNSALLGGYRLPRIPEMATNNEDTITQIHRYTLDQSESSNVTCNGTRPTGSSVCGYLPEHHHSLLPLQANSHLQTLATGLGSSPRPVTVAPAGQRDHNFPSIQPNNNVSRTIRVPSASDSSSVSAYDDHKHGPGQHSHNSASAQTTQPSGSRSSIPTMSTGSSISMVNKDLVDDIVEIHDVCLRATQRYLEALRVNWRLRHGQNRIAPSRAGFIGRRPVASRILKKEGHDSIGIHLQEAQQQGLPRPRQQTGSEHGPGQGSSVEGSGPRLRNSQRTNPIPRPTNSLLENIHHICELIWQRARRDRVDVLGAEAKACRNMKALQECGETIVLYNLVDFESDPDGCFAKVLEAGKDICRELGDLEALKMIEEWGDSADEGIA